MRAAFPEPSNDWRRPSRRQRAKAIGLTIAAELVFVILFLGLAPKLIEKAEAPGEPVTFDLVPPAPQAEAPPRKAKTKAAKTAKARSPRAPIAPPIPPVIPLAKSPLVELSKEDLAASDIATLGTPGETVGKSAAMGPGAGPGGARLYKAEWVVEPTRAELAFYMPATNEDRITAAIACKTIPNYRVENCVLLSESPMGTGLARAMRLAAWQFRVRPPRIDGKPLIGVWVRINFDFGKEGA